MATKKTGRGRAEPLDPKIVKKLLDRLSTDNAFRRLFKKDAEAALASIGYRPAAGTTSVAQCLQFSTTDRIAPKAKIVRMRQRLEATMTLPWSFLCPVEVKAD